MKLDEREAVESRAERCLRRGELGEALNLLRSVSEAFPEDVALAARIRDLSDSLQPAELLNPKSNFAPEPKPAVDAPSDSPSIEGERLFDKGDYAGAAAAYREAVEAEPHNELFRERLEQLYQLAVAVRAPRATHTPRVHRAVRADPANLLSSLLNQITARRRPA